jgi:hypothetical protein
MGEGKSAALGRSSEKLVRQRRAMEICNHRKAHKEFRAEHRPEGWNAWSTLSNSPAAPASAAPASRLVFKESHRQLSFQQMSLQ